MVNIDNIKIFIDGSGTTNRPIGWGVIVVDNNDEVIDIFGGNRSIGTNNMAELLGFITSIEYLKKKRLTATIYSDSEYVVKGTNFYLEDWKLKNFIHVKNEDLWKNVNKLIYRDLVQFKLKHVKGHSGNYFNDLAHEEANYQRKLLT